MAEVFQAGGVSIPLSVLLRERYGISQSSANRLREYLMKQGITPRQIRNLDIPSSALPPEYRGREQVTRQLKSLLEAQAPERPVLISPLKEGVSVQKTGQEVNVKQLKESSYPEIEAIRTKIEPPKQTVYVGVEKGASEKIQKEIKGLGYETAGGVLGAMEKGELEAFKTPEGVLFIKSEEVSAPEGAGSDLFGGYPEDREYFGWTQDLFKLGEKGKQEIKEGFDVLYKPSGEGFIQPTGGFSTKLITGTGKALAGYGLGAVSFVVEPQLWSLAGKGKYAKGIPESDLYKKVIVDGKEMSYAEYIQLKEKAQREAGAISFGFMVGTPMTTFKPSATVEAGWYDLDTAEAWAGYPKVSDPFLKPTYDIYGRRVGGYAPPDETLGLIKPTELQAQLSPKTIEPLPYSLYAPPEAPRPLSFFELAQKYGKTKPELIQSFMEETGQTGLFKDFIARLETSEKAPSGQRLKAVLEEVKTEEALARAKAREEAFFPEVARAQATQPLEIQTNLALPLEQVTPEAPVTVEVVPVEVSYQGKTALIFGKKGQADPSQVFATFKAKKGSESLSKFGEVFTKGQADKRFSDFSSMFKKAKPPEYEEVVYSGATLPYWEDYAVPVIDLKAKSYGRADVRLGVEPSVKASVFDVTYSKLDFKTESLLETKPYIDIEAGQRAKTKSMLSQAQAQAQSQALNLGQTQAQAQAQDLGQIQEQDFFKPSPQAQRFISRPVDTAKPPPPIIERIPTPPPPLALPPTGKRTGRSPFMLGRPAGIKTRGVGLSSYISKTREEMITGRPASEWTGKEREEITLRTKKKAFLGGVKTPFMKEKEEKKKERAKPRGIAWRF